MDTVVAIAALVVAVAALGVAIDAYRKAGRGTPATAGRAAPAPDRAPPPEFVKTAPSTSAPSRANHAVPAAAPVDPLILARVDALEAQVASLAAEAREAPAPRKSPARSAEPVADAPSLAARRVFP